MYGTNGVWFSNHIVHLRYGSLGIYKGYLKLYTSCYSKVSPGGISNRLLASRKVCGEGVYKIRSIRGFEKRVIYIINIVGAR